MSSSVDPYLGEKRKPAVFLTVGIVLLLLLLVLGGGLATLGLFGPRGSQSLAADSGTTSVLPQVTEPQTVLPQVTEPQTSLPQVTDPEPSLQAPQDTAMPADVRDWLEHLRKTEDRRKRLSSEHVGELMVMLTKMQTSGLTDALKGIFGEEEDTGEQAPSQADSVKIDASEKRKEWQELLAFFQSYPPPAECVPIQASYSHALGETSGMIIEILEAVDMAQESPEKAIAALTAIQGTSGDRIDEYAKQTDEQVQSVCDRYKTRKWFKIAADVGGGLLGKLGL